MYLGKCHPPFHSQYSLDKDVCGVGLRREAVIADVDTGIRHSQTVCVQGVEAIGVLWQRGNIGGNGIYVDIVENNVLSTHEECCPAGRVLEMKTRDLDVGSVIGKEKDGTVVFVVGVQNLRAREAVPPSLSVTIQNA